MKNRLRVQARDVIVFPTATATVAVVIAAGSVIIADVTNNLEIHGRLRSTQSRLVGVATSSNC
jgi:hypothetical protein